MEEHFEIGSVVQLNSGGPVMTVFGLDTNTEDVQCARVVWFDDDGREQMRLIPLACLKLAPNGAVP